ncbi:MAG: DUF2179 domain-containing protein [Nanoarchaeota archaeon]|nr:DUF2179 domain-containing protein [Nanoarchaeota archaeon]
MVFESILTSPWYIYLVLPLLIFFGRVADVTLGTMRHIFIAKGIKFWVPLLGFVEIMIWLLVARQVIADISNVISYFAYAGGFATGNYVGMKLEEKLSFGKIMLRIVTGNNEESLIKKLKEQKYGLTIVQAKGVEGDVKVIFSIMERKQLTKAISILKEFNPHAFYTIEDVRFANENGSYAGSKRNFLRIFDFQRKAK